MSHVLEHLHDPVAVLNEIYRLLRPGGRIWLATPNIEGPLSAYFHRHWRGLESPRHLNLFSPDLVKSVLQNAGFGSVGILAPSLEARWMACASFSLMDGRGSVRPRDLPSEVRATIRHADNNAKRDYHYGEAITAIGYKPL
jgi:SAM-dependent methyltransferase